MAPSENTVTTSSTPAPGAYNGGKGNDHDEMPRSNEIRQNIEHTRSQMDRTFNALEARLTPGQLLGDGWQLVKDGSTAGASRLWRLAKDHPVPAAVIGVGLGWLVFDSTRGTSSARSSRSSEASHRPGNGNGRSLRHEAKSLVEQGQGHLASAAQTVKDAAQSTVSGAKDLVGRAGDAVGHATDQVKETVGGWTDQAGEAAGSLREQARDLSGRLQHQAGRVRNGVGDLIDERPLVAGAATLALGLLAGLAVPSTRREDELMGETRDQLLEDAKSAGREVLDKGKQVAHAAADTLQQEAERQHLNPSDLTDRVGAVAKETFDKVKSEAKQTLQPENPPQHHEAVGAGTKPQGRSGMPTTPTTPTTPTPSRATPVEQWGAAPGSKK
ncbi:MAG: DUF3618 domain-containing protein [Acidobacteriota bacterium]|nr:DUF3618 domain-containing protein [Acidobacteriota bacterium]